MPPIASPTADREASPSSRAIPLLVGLVALLVLVGCLGGGPAEEAPGGALEVRSQADEVAREWDPEAELVSVAGGEGELAELVRNGSLRWLPAYVEGTEAELGDGQSPRWAFEYHAGGDGLGVLVAADGTVVESPEIDVTPQPSLQEVQVDSTQAVQQAAEEHTAWGDVSEEAGVAYALYHDEERGRPVWALGLTTDGERVVVLVDARTGEDLGVSEDGRDPITPRGRSIGPDAPPRAAGTFEGRLDLVGDEQSWAISLQGSDHPALALHLQVEEPVTGTANATLTREDRRLAQLEAGPRETNATATWPVPDSGEYEVQVELADGIDQAYTLHWCAPGTEEGDDRTPACQAWESRDG